MIQQDLEFKCQQHDDHIIGMCTSEQCLAERLVCMRCFKQFHQYCPNFLSKQELTLELQEFELDLEYMLSQSMKIDQFDEVQVDIVAKLKQVKDKVKIIEQQQKALEQIKATKQGQITKQLWENSYKLLINRSQAGESLSRTNKEIKQNLYEINKRTDSLFEEQNQIYQQHKRFILNKILILSLESSPYSQTRYLKRTKRIKMEPSWNDFVMKGCTIQTTAIKSIACSPDGKYIACACENLIKVYDPLAETHLVQELKGHKNTINSIVYTNNGQLIVSGSCDGTIKIWDVLQGIEQRQLSIKNSPNNQICLSPNEEQIAIASSNGKVRVWDFPSVNRQIQWYFSNTIEVRCLCYSPDGKYIASAGNDSFIKVRDAETYKDVPHGLGSHKQAIQCIQFLHNGQELLSGGADGRITIQVISTGTKIAYIKISSDMILSLKASPDSRKIMIGTKNEGLMIWNIQSERRLELRKGKGQINTVCYSSNAKFMISGSEKGQLVIQEVPHRYA